MKRLLPILTVCLALIAIVTGCKKEEETPTTAADTIAGTYTVRDTMYSNGCDGGAPGDVDFDEYSIVIKKMNSTTVTISSFQGCGASFVAEVTETTLTPTNNNFCGGVNLYNMVGTVSGGKIRLTYKYFGLCEFSRRATATKQ